MSSTVSDRMEIVRLDRVGVQFPGCRVLTNLSLSIPAGGFYFLTGASASGKTTLLRLLSRELRPTEGHIKVFGKDITRLKHSEIPSFRRNLGLVFPTHRLLSHLTLVENVALPLKIAGTSAAKARLQAREMLAWAGLEEVLTELPKNVSESEKQRAALARAVITRPLLVLADEPTACVDYPSAVHMIQLMEEMNKVGTTVIIATHNIALAADFSYPELHLQNGHVVANNQSGMNYGT